MNVRDEHFVTHREARDNHLSKLERQIFKRISRPSWILSPSQFIVHLLKFLFNHCQTQNLRTV